MATKEKIIEELNFVTDTLSAQVRTTAIGTLALSWGLLIGESATTKALAAPMKWHLVGVGAASIVVLFLDFLQYVAGYFNTLSVYTGVMRNHKSEGSYDDKAFFFRLRMFFFYSKMIALSVTVAWLLTALAHWLVVS